jgi:hypothetical protein
MRYLLVGNGPSHDVEAKAKHADAVVQVNGCAHGDLIPSGAATHIFIVNTGFIACPTVVKALLTKKDQLFGARIVLARNPLFYRVKHRLAALARSWTTIDCVLNDAWKELDCPTEVVSFVSALSLEYKLWRLGKPPSFLPSTGMVAYHWLCRRLQPGDSLDVTGFTFEGWDGHPWAIEKRLITGVYYPGYRDDPSYERRGNVKRDSGHLAITHPLDAYRPRRIGLACSFGKILR